MKTETQNQLKYKSQEELFKLFKSNRTINLFGSLLALVLLSGLLLIVSMVVQ